MTAEQIIDILYSGKFDDWYINTFADWVQGEVGAKPRTEILKDIRTIFKLEE